jgi:hypothetical protein
MALDQELISKKDLLELTGISYGQLYRWKRKNLVPEQWFIRKSTFTGQETFFPKERMLARIDKIKNMKDDLSLDALADVFSPNAANASLKVAELIERNIVSKTTVQYYPLPQGGEAVCSFDRILALYVAEKLLLSGEMSREEGRMLLDVMENHYRSMESSGCDVVLIRKMGISSFLLISGTSKLAVEPDTKLIVRLPLTACLEELKMKLF